MKADENWDVNSNEIEELEAVLFNFQEQWKKTQERRAARWRKYFLLCFIIAISVSFYSPTFWWTSLIVIAYFAGSLFTLLHQNAKTSHQIIEHKKQLKLARLLINFNASH